MQGAAERLAPTMNLVAKVADSVIEARVSTNSTYRCY